MWRSARASAPGLERLDVLLEELVRQTRRGGRERGIRLLQLHQKPIHLSEMSSFLSFGLRLGLNIPAKSLHAN